MLGAGELGCVAPCLGTYWLFLCPASLQCAAFPVLWDTRGILSHARGGLVSPGHYAEWAGVGSETCLGAGTPELCVNPSLVLGHCPCAQPVPWWLLRSPSTHC